MKNTFPLLKDSLKELQKTAINRGEVALTNNEEPLTLLKNKANRQKIRNVNQDEANLIIKQKDQHVKFIKRTATRAMDIDRLLLYEDRVLTKRDLNLHSARLGLSFEAALKALELAAQITRDTLAISASASSVSPGAQSTTTVSEVVLMEDKTLSRLRDRYTKLLNTIELPENGLKTIDQARAAARLVTTYKNLTKRERERGLEPTRRDVRVIEANRLAEAFYRNRQRAGAAGNDLPRPS